MELCFEAGRKGYREVAAQTALRRDDPQYNRKSVLRRSAATAGPSGSIVTPDDIGSNTPIADLPVGSPVFPAYNLWSEVCKQDS